MRGGTLLAGLSSLLCLVVNSGFSQAQEQGTPASCNSPRGVLGSCIPIRECPALLSILQSRPLRAEAVDLLRASQCGFQGRNPMVCCTNENLAPQRGGTDGQTETGNNNPYISGTPQVTPPPTESTNGIEIDLSNNPLLPSNCGQDLSQRIVGGERTEIGEFPWMGLLEYRKPTGKTTACGGVLINSRYILTAAHCIKGKDLPPSWTLESVRLGEYDTDTERDCVYEAEDSLICADDPVTVGIEEQIPHENYRPLSKDQKYDIALLRLNRNVPFTPYIKSICLPSNISLGNRLYVAGWGKTESRSASNIKLKLTLPLADKEQCDATYSRAGVRLGYGQICAGGLTGKDSCRGDSGGPLMAVERGPDGRGRYTSVGIVSFGPTPCGMTGWPGVYTRVIDFVPWILSKLRP